MRRRIYATAFVTLVVAVVIGWEAYHCHRAADECQAAQMVSSSQFAGSTRASDTQKQHSKDETTRSCSKANSFLCLILTPANLPTIYLVILGISGISVGAETLWAIERQGNIMERQISIPHRAYLANGAPEMALDGTVRIPIENYGHIAARMISAQVEVLVVHVPDRQIVYRHDLTAETNDLIIPGKNLDCALFVRLPRETLGQSLEIMLGCFITYEVGFQDRDGREIRDTARFCPAYLTTQKAWVSGWRGPDMDFRNEVPKMRRQTD